MKAIEEVLHGWADYEKIREFLKKEKGIIQISGCVDAGKAHMVYGVGNGFGKKIIATFSEQKARELYEDCRFFDANTVYYPAKDILFYQSDLRGNQLTKERMNAIKVLLEEEQMTLVTTFDGLMNRLIRPEKLERFILQLSLGEELILTDFTKQLVAMGYEKNYQAEAGGQFAVRGGIIDIYPLTEENPYRIELWGDEIDSIRSFSAESQRSLENLETVKIYPAAEIIFEEAVLEKGLKKIEADAKKLSELYQKEMKTEEAHRVRMLASTAKESIEQFGSVEGMDAYLTYFEEDTVSLLDYFSKEDALVFLDEPVRAIEKGRVIEKEFQESMKQRLEKGYILPGQMDSLYSYEEIAARLAAHKVIGLAALEMKEKALPAKEYFSIQMKTVNPYNNSFELLIKDLKRYKKNHYRVILLSGSRTRANRLAQDITEEGISAFYTQDEEHEVKPGEVMVAYGKIKKGYEYPDLQCVIISESDIFGREKKKKKKRRIYEGEQIQSFSDLHVGDYVVHENHGLGIYRGIEKVEVDKVVKDYIKIEYAKGGNLYILATQLELIQKYAGADAKKPKLNKLGTQEWSKTKSKVHKAVADIAQDLVELYAKRQNREGYVYGEDTVWQREFEEMFPFEETEDQELAIEATKQDMESKKIMDRLICGDVGYGKTEVAIRAAFKAVQEGKQVVYLVPTTILAQQHYNTFASRMKDFPVRVDLPGLFSVSNSLAAIAVCAQMGIPEKAMQEALSAVRVRGRCEAVPVYPEMTLLIDYAHNAMSLESLLKTLRKYHPKRLICLFGCGGNRARDRRFQMGEVSGRLADLTVITSDNPRDEEPQAILDDIRTGIGKTEGAFVEIADRKEAIRYVIENRQPGDLVVLAGKGHETYQIRKGKRYEMDERVLIQEILEEDQEKGEDRRACFKNIRSLQSFSILCI